MTMRNNGYLGVLSSFFSSIFSYNKDKGSAHYGVLRVLGKLVLALIALIIFGFALMKVYEVPVYYTKINVVLNQSLPKDDDGLHIIVRRDYDRFDKNTIFPDSIDKGNHCAGIFINGIFEYRSNVINDSFEEIDTTMNKLSRAFEHYNRPPIKDPQIIDIKVQTSYRQKFVIGNYSTKENSKSFTNSDVTFSSFDGERVIEYKQKCKDYFFNRKLQSIPSNNGCLLEDIYAASKEDSIIHVHTGYFTTAYEKPSIFKAAEDVSKIVEIIEIGHSNREKKEFPGAWAFTKSLKIDYVGPAEFSDNIHPKPDEINLNSILYTDSMKIEEIGRKGLRYHVRFPDMENIQEARIFILSGLVTGLAALVFKYLYRLIIGLWLIIKSNTKYKERTKRIIMIILVIVGLLIMYYLYAVVSEAYIDPFELNNN